LDNADGAAGEVVVKRPKKKTNVWSKSTTRKTSRKSKPVKIPSGEKKEECIEVNPAQRYLLEERNGIQLSKVSF
jgi:Set1/Ash2 histone methyltransferase complex subunit ASH2